MTPAAPPAWIAMHDEGRCTRYGFAVVRGATVVRARRHHGRERREGPGPVLDPGPGPLRA
ncbi:hypothetical protein JCM9533A_24990 [Catenuloplanes niger JCM 9533]|uniref:Uncharacterized protein n=1 Tax=Catenuloplanes niger TaxID=587534 RepID=A0AAE3ZWP6_9ACTN|nr:hypothetical protein [Catenuloplanes niger]